MTTSTQLQILRPSKPPHVFDIDAGVYTIGSDNDCKICLNHGDVDARHAILTIRADSFWVEDLDARSGTAINGKPIKGRMETFAGDKILIGPFTLILGSVPPPAPSMPADSVAATPSPAQKQPAPTPSPPATPAPEPVHTNPRALAEMEQKRSIQQQIHRELVERLDLKRLTASRVAKKDLEERARAIIRTIVNEVSHRLPPGIDPEQLIKDIYDEALGLGPLEEFLEDGDITEIMVNGHNHIYVECAGRIVLTDKSFLDDNSVLAIIERIVSPLGRRIDESQPYVDARLPDGSRVNAIIHPLSLVGPCITIRKFSKIPFTDDDLIAFGTLTRDICEFARLCVLLRKNIVVSGGTGSGKTSLLNVLSAYLPDSERILTVEDAAELRLKQTHVVRLEARPPNIEGKGAVTIRDLVRNALRMRPDRIVVGECRGGEALDMLQAMNTGHDGSLTTVHANSPRDVISRLETMVLMSGMDLPLRAIREQISSAVDLIVHESRFSDGTRKVTRITEVVGQEGEQITMQDIFEYVQTGVDEDGKVIGHFRPTGAVPTFIEEIQSRGLTVDRTMFDPTAREGGSSHRM